MTTPHDPPKSNIIEFSKHKFLRSRMNNIKSIDSTPSTLYFATHASRKLYGDVPFNDDNHSLTQPPSDEDDSGS